VRPPKRETRCKSCDAPIHFLRDRSGKIQVLDARPPIWKAVKDPDGSVWCERVEHAAVSHFATCPNAAAHSKGKGRRS